MPATLIEPTHPAADDRTCLVVPKRARLRRLRRVDAAIVAILAVYNVCAASRLLFIDDTTVRPWRGLWPILFLAAAAASAWFAWCALEVRCRHITAALSWSGACNITAYASRALILAAGLWHHQQRGGPSVTKLQFGVITWAMLAGLTWYIWLYVLKPGVELSKHKILPER